MVNGSKKSRSQRRVTVKTPGNRIVTHYRKRKPSHTVCGKCSAKLNGVPRDIPSVIGKMSKSQRVPSRMFGGNLCTKCTRIEIIARSQ